MTGEGIADQVAFLRKRLEGWGFVVEVHPTTSHPIIYAEVGPKDAKFTWLLYGHYDVYPADEKQEGWRTKPFEPVVDGDRIWGRGTGDNKGQHLAMLNAIALWRETRGELPVRIKVILEGDEETGSIPLPKFVEENRARLKADLCCYSDGPMFPNDQPVLLMGVRGNLGLEFHAKGAKRNLHSGQPRRRLAQSRRSTSFTCSPRWSIATASCSCRAPRTRKSKSLPWISRRCARSRSITRASATRSAPSPRPAPTTASSTSASCCARRSTSPGSARATRARASRTSSTRKRMAKADVRLVGGQDPDAVLAAIRKFAHDRGYHGIEIKSMKGTPASRTPLDHPMVPMVKDAVAKGFGREPLVVPSLGGTTPDFVFTKLLGIPSIVVPLAPYDENNHAPNESTKVSLYLAGVRSGMHLLESLARA